MQNDNESESETVISQPLEYGLDLVELLSQRHIQTSFIVNIPNTVREFRTGFMDASPNQILDARADELLRERPRSMADYLDVMLTDLHAPFYPGPERTVRTKYFINNGIDPNFASECDISILLLARRDALRTLVSQIANPWFTYGRYDPVYFSFPVVIHDGPNFSSDEFLVQTDIVVEVLEYYQKLPGFHFASASRVAFYSDVDVIKVKVIDTGCYTIPPKDSVVYLALYPVGNAYTYDAKLASDFNAWAVRRATSMKRPSHIISVWVVATLPEDRGVVGPVNMANGGDFFRVKWSDVMMGFHKQFTSCVFTVPHYAYSHVVRLCVIASGLLEHFPTFLALEIMSLAALPGTHARWRLANLTAYLWRFRAMCAMILVLVSRGFGPWDVWQQMRYMPYDYCNRTYLTHLTK